MPPNHYSITQPLPRNVLAKRYWIFDALTYLIHFRGLHCIVEVRCQKKQSEKQEIKLRLAETKLNPTSHQFTKQIMQKQKDTEQVQFQLSKECSTRTLERKKIINKLLINNTWWQTNDYFIDMFDCQHIASCVMVLVLWYHHHHYQHLYQVPPLLMVWSVHNRLEIETDYHPH